MEKRSKTWMLLPWSPGEAFSIMPNWDRKPLKSGHINNFGNPAHIQQQIKLTKIVIPNRHCFTTYLNVPPVGIRSFGTLEEAKQFIDDKLRELGFILLDDTNLMGMV